MISKLSQSPKAEVLKLFNVILTLHTSLFMEVLIVLSFYLQSQTSNIIFLEFLSLKSIIQIFSYEQQNSPMHSRVFAHHFPSFGRPCLLPHYNDEKYFNIEHVSLTFNTSNESHVKTHTFTAHKEKREPLFFYVFSIEVKNKIYFEPNASQIIHFPIKPTLPLTFKNLWK